MADVFISYKREELAQTARIADALKAEGYSVFYDLGPTGIYAGEVWDKRLETELNSASCCVVLWSLASVNSDNVRSEARRANRRGILLPALITHCETPIGLDTLQAANLIGWDGNRAHPQWRYLVDHGVKRLINERAKQRLFPNLGARPSARVKVEGDAPRSGANEPPWNAGATFFSGLARKIQSKSRDNMDLLGKPSVKDSNNGKGSFTRDFAIWSPYVTIGLFNTVMFAGAAAGLGHYGLSGSLMNTVLGVCAAFIIRLIARNIRSNIIQGILGIICGIFAVILIANFLAPPQQF